jgi:hypothetical protein
MAASTLEPELVVQRGTVAVSVPLLFAMGSSR